MCSTFISVGAIVRHIKMPFCGRYPGGWMVDEYSNFGHWLERSFCKLKYGLNAATAQFKMLNTG